MISVVFVLLNRISAWWLQDSLFKTEREVLTLLVIDGFRSILFVSVFRGSLPMIALFRTIID